MLKEGQRQATNNHNQVGELQRQKELESLGQTLLESFEYKRGTDEKTLDV